jgi:hypothetical protein
MAYASFLSFCSVLIQRIVLPSLFFFLPAHVHVHVHFNANDCLKCVMGMLFGTVRWQYLLSANHAAGLGRRHQFGCVFLRPCVMPTEFNRRASLLGSLLAELGVSTRLGGSARHHQETAQGLCASPALHAESHETTIAVVARFGIVHVCWC